VKQWRLGYNFTDSGPLHAPGSVANLILTQTYTEFGWVNYTYALSCDSSSAQLIFYINGNLSDSFDCIYGCGLNISRSSRRVGAGINVFTWSYIKNSIGNVSTHACDRAIITSISLSGVDNGGSPLCAPCSSGYVSKSNSTSCAPCQPGQYSSPLGDTCLNCSVGNFSYAPASTKCLRCGAGTTSAQPGSSQCTVPCNITFSAANRTYDFSSLSPNATIGPIRDLTTNHKYSLNLCNRILCEASSTYGAYVCQTLDNPDGTTEITNLARVVSFNPLPNAGLGVAVSFSNGDYYTPQACTKIVNINLVCDDVVNETPTLLSNTSCDLEFEWRSIYSCPLCTLPDFVTSYAFCINNSRNLIYSYSTPKYCHDGVPLPSPQPTNCTTCTSAHYSYTYDTTSCGSCGKCTPNSRVKSYFWIEPKKCLDGVPLPAAKSEQCIACTLNDTNEVLGECIAQKQIKTYTWKNDSSCVDGINLPPDELVNCVEPFKFSTSTIIALSAGGATILLLLAVFLLYLYIKNRRLYASYTKLQQQAGHEMDADPLDNQLTE